MKSKLVALTAAAAISLGAGTAVVTIPAVAAPTAISVSEAASLPTLKKGNSGGGVKVLQRLLNADGAKLAVDGSFGEGTQAAVKAYQKKKGLNADGIVGRATWSKLLPRLKYADRGASVTVLQRTLNDHGQRLAADGSFGNSTRSGVIAFQKSKGLKADGFVGPATWGALLGQSGSAPTPQPGKRTYVVMDQLQTGRFASENCGPTSAMMALVAYGVKPDYYGGPSQYGDAVHHFRRDAHRMDNQWVGVGSSGDQLRRGLSSYQVPNRKTDLEDALTAVRNGKMVIAHGHSSRLPWMNGGAGHYILVVEHLGGDQYRVLDPWKGRDKVATADQLRYFASKNQPDGRPDRHYNQTVVG